MDASLPMILSYLQDMSNDSRRLGSLRLLQLIIEAVNIRYLPICTLSASSHNDNDD